VTFTILQALYSKYYCPVTAVTTTNPTFSFMLLRYYYYTTTTTSPRANYTDRATALVGEVSANFADTGCHVTILKKEVITM
jgi:hypothetical protein